MATLTDQEKRNRQRRSLTKPPHAGGGGTQAAKGGPSVDPSTSTQDYRSSAAPANNSNASPGNPSFPASFMTPQAANAATAGPNVAPDGAPAGAMGGTPGGPPGGNPGGNGGNPGGQTGSGGAPAADGQDSGLLAQAYEGANRALPYLPSPQAVQGTADAISRVADYTAEGVEEAETPGMKVANALGRPIGGMAAETAMGFGDQVDEAARSGRDFVRGLGGATDSSTGGTARAQARAPQGGDEGQAVPGSQPAGRQDQPPQGEQAPSAIEERQFPGGGTYYANTETNTFAGTREGAQEGVMRGGGLSIMPTRNGGSIAGSQAGLPSPRGSDPTPERERMDTARLRRQANQSPSLSMGLSEFFQTAAQRQQAQQALSRRAEIQQAQMENAQQERQDRRDYIAKLIQTRADLADANESDPEYEVTTEMTPEGQQTNFYRMDNSGITKVEPNKLRKEYSNQDYAKLEEALQEGPKVFLDRVREYQDSHGAVPQRYKALAQRYAQKIVDSGMEA